MEAPLSVAVTERDQARSATRSPAVRLYLISVIVPWPSGPSSTVIGSSTS